MRFLPPFFFFPSPWMSISDPIRILPVGVCKRQVEDVEYTIDGKDMPPGIGCQVATLP